VNAKHKRLPLPSDFPLARMLSALSSCRDHSSVTAVATLFCLSLNQVLESKDTFEKKAPLEWVVFIIMITRGLMNFILIIGCLKEYSDNGTH
jgi:hypothetical protein